MQVPEQTMLNSVLIITHPLVIMSYWEVTMPHQLVIMPYK